MCTLWLLVMARLPVALATVTSTLARRSRSTTRRASHSSVPSAKKTTALLISIKPPETKKPRAAKRARGMDENGQCAFLSASSRARRTLSSALSTRLTRLMMALDAPVLSMISV